MLKVVTHAAVIITLYLAFSFALFLGLQVDPVYGNIGLLAVAVLTGLYVYLGFVKKSSRGKPAGEPVSRPPP